MNPDLIIVRVRPDGPLFDFKAGQYTVLGLTGSSPRATFSEPETEPPRPERLIRRAYSISSSSKQDEYLEFYISLVRSGELTPRLLFAGTRKWSKTCSNVSKGWGFGLHSRKEAGNLHIERYW